jgi:hypothetical protein
MPGLPTPLVQAFVRQLVGWISAFTPFVLMLVLAVRLALDLAAGSGTHINPYSHGIAAVIITLVIVNLGPILGALGVAHC